MTPFINRRLPGGANRMFVLVIFVGMLLSHSLFAQSPSPVSGDFDTNGVVDLRDLVRLIQHINAANSRVAGSPDLLPAGLAPYADVNEDGLLNQTDADLVADVILGLPLPVKPPSPVTFTPVSGSGEVGLTVRPKAVFPKPVDLSTLNSNNFYASFSGRKLSATIVPAENGTFAWLYLNQSMPNAAQIQVTVDGSTILTRRGAVLDADGDGMPGGAVHTSFSTVSVAPVPGTILSSRVVDPGPDLIPRTADDVSPGGNGFNYLLPIRGVKVYVLGLENNFAYTDANGQFTLTNMPVGDVKVVLDGRTAVNPPGGYYFPEMVMDTTFVPGSTNGVMTIRDASGNVVRDGNGVPIQALAMYLPRIASNVLQTVVATNATMITLQSNAAYNLPTNQQQYLTVEIMPNSLVGMDGQLMATAQVGVSVVPPELVRDMLPPGLLQHTFDVTVQAPGVSIFSTPAPMTFPNVFNAPPGTKLNFLSFDHTTGRLVVEGTATVSEDGLSVRTDPGTGITHPGWHGMTPPGMMIDPLSGKPCEGTDGKTETAKEAGKAAFEAAFNAEEGFNGVATLLNAGFRGLSFLNVVGNATECVTGTGFGSVASCGKALAGLGVLATEAPLAEAILAGEALLQAAALFHEAAEKMRQLRELPPCGHRDATPAEIAAAETLAPLLDEIDERVARQLPGLQRMRDDGEGIRQIIVHLDPAQPQLGLSPDQFNDLVDLMNDYQTSGSAIEGDGFFMLTLFAILRDLEVFLRLHFDVSPVERLSCLVYWSAEFNGTVLRGRSPSQNSIEFFAPPNSLVRLRVYDPNVNETGISVFITGASGVRLTPLLLTSPAPASPDADRDGLSDDTEAIIGTDPENADTDGDGIGDFAEVRQCQDPLSGRVLSTGLIASLPLPGEAKEVVLAGSASNTAQATAYVALGSRGLGIVNVSQFQMPIVLSQLDLAGDATDVAFDSTLMIVAVAANGGGLHFVDVSDPMLPVLLRTIHVNASQVETLGDVAYATVGGDVHAYDLSTGVEVQALALGGGAIMGLGREGSYLYTMDTNRRLRVIDLSSGDMEARGALVLSAGGGKISVGGGIVYVAAGNGIFGGFATVGVANPDAPVLLSGVDALNIEGGAIAVNGSGLAVSIGSVRGPQGQIINALDVMNVSDPTDTGAFLTRFDLPTTPFSVAIGAGIAFVADGMAGLQVVNYRSFDNLGVPPTINLTGTLTFTSPTNAVIEEGTVVRVTANVTDDVQVRNVDFSIDGTNVASDVSFPFEHQFVAPALTTGRTNFTLRARAGDTGGNMAWTPEITVAIMPDFTAPHLRRLSPPTNSIVDTTDSIFAFFSEPMDPARLSTATFSLTWAGPDHRLDTPDDLRVTNAVVGMRETIHSVVFTATNGLAQGLYRATLATNLADRAGNSISNSFTWTFWLLRGGPEGDADSDGIFNSAEISYGFNPTQGDTDGDGWDDGVEFAEGVNYVTNAVLRPGIIVASMPPVSATLPGPEELGLPGVAMSLALPPVLVTLPGNHEIGLVGAGASVAQPPILVTLPGFEEVGEVGPAMTLARPPLLVTLPDKAEVGDGTDAIVAKPVLLINLPGSDELGLGTEAAFARPPLLIASTNSPTVLNPFATTVAPKRSAQVKLPLR